MTQKREYMIFVIVAAMAGSIASTPARVSAGETTIPPREITTEERVSGLALFWKEADNNFAFFDRVPDLNWDAAFTEYYADVAGAESDIAYIRLLQSFAAQLQEANRVVWMPGNLRPAVSSFPPFEAT